MILILSNRRTRIWLGELPEISYQTIETIERVINVKPSSVDSEERKAAIEMFRPAGGRAHYGLLGAQFIPQHSEQLSIQVAIASPETAKFTWSLASQYVDPRVGLPEEFVEGVFEGVVSTGELLTSGIVRFNIAAYNDVGSSHAFFRKLSAAVIRLLASDVEARFGQDINKLLQI